MKRRILKAAIQRVLGTTTHYVGTIEGEEPHKTEEIGTPRTVEIHEDDGGFYLFRKDAQGVTLADTWHVTLAEAKAQAVFEYGIEEKDWQELIH